MGSLHASPSQASTALPPSSPIPLHKLALLSHPSSRGLEGMLARRVVGSGGIQAGECLRVSLELARAGELT